MQELIISNLSKTYKNGVKALQDISLQIPIGMYGLLGPNGAGKSTLMRTIATLQAADSGSITLGGIDVLAQPNELKKVLGYLPQQFGVYPALSAELLLNHLAVLKGILNNKERKEMVQALLHKVNLYEVRKQKLGGFSGGMKQRFGIAQALLNNPRLLMVDEPTAGLDPVERNRFYNLLSEVGENTIVILSTHIVDDVKELCSRMAIINKGKVLVQGNPVQIMENLQGRLYEKMIHKNELEQYKKEYQLISDRLYLGNQIVHVLSDTHPGPGFKLIDANLEDVYMSQIFNA
ncbi:ABC transporter ATP-binding protein [Pedobacter alluvionis]|uniref:ABC transporter ATP-binding protein n=1 Tax=Pedobacter alluvionis TaxID=475253 RepID=A0A497YC37_9SPHI|nr:ABC transporter ATP-binding protein [Pedobacter alluvionis]RLJ80471.1 ABC-type multidrug transport system ATPase subunit [Pedobacter alluvionis]TFB31745.1 ABC transporter ATP-binding protein [Pedobacter alluvionis]